jgi:hypothetical protein
MSAPSLAIVQPKHGAALTGAAPVPLVGTVSGDAAGLFFKWFSSLNAVASKDHPELNTANHSAAILNWSAPLAEFGSHAIVLAAADQDGNDLASVKAVKRSAMTGGAPPTAPAPCVVHRLVAEIRTPVANAPLSKGAATIEFLAPLRWAKQDPGNAASWIADADYQKINGITLDLRLAPVGAGQAADIPLDLAELPFFRADDKTWFRRSGSLPGNLGTGKHTLTVSARAGGSVVSAAREVTLTP